MWEELLKLALSNGIWAVLFCGLLVYQLKDSKKREIKYQSTIETLAANLEVVNDIKETVMEVKAKTVAIACKFEGIK